MAWQSKTNDLKEKVRHLFNSEVMSDVKIIVGKERRIYRTHKWLLSLSSGKFNNMFYGRSKGPSEIVIPDVKDEIFNIFMRFIYTEELVINSPAQAFEVFLFAKEYQVIQMKDKCVRIIPFDTIAEMYEIAASLISSENKPSDTTRENDSHLSKGCNSVSENTCYHTGKSTPYSSNVNFPEEISLEEEEYSTQSLPTYLNTPGPNKYSAELIEKVENLADLIESPPLMKECKCQLDDCLNERLQKIKPRYRERFIEISKLLGKKCKEEEIKNVLELFSEDSKKSEVEIIDALKKWGKRVFQQENSEIFQKLEELLQKQLDEMKKENARHGYSARMKLNNLKKKPETNVRIPKNLRDFEFKLF